MTFMSLITELDSHKLGILTIFYKTSTLPETRIPMWLVFPSPFMFKHWQTGPNTHEETSQTELH